MADPIGIDPESYAILTRLAEQLNVSPTQMLRQLVHRLERETVAGINISHHVDSMSRHVQALSEYLTMHHKGPVQARATPATNLPAHIQIELQQSLQPSSPKAVHVAVHDTQPRL